MGYRTIYERLAALPPERRRLIATTYFDATGCCALGACVPLLATLPEELQHSSIHQLLGLVAHPDALVSPRWREDFARECAALATTPDELQRLQDVNDNFNAETSRTLDYARRNESEAARYQAVLAWLAEQVRSEICAVGTGIST